MKFLADECCDDGMVKYLREKGIDVTYIQESKSGIADSQVLSEAYQEKRILITEDKDFGELVYRFKNRTRFCLTPLWLFMVKDGVV